MASGTVVLSIGAENVATISGVVVAPENVVPIGRPSDWMDTNVKGVSLPGDGSSFLQALIVITIVSSNPQKPILKLIYLCVKVKIKV